MVGVGIGSTLLSPEPRAHEPVVGLPTPTHRPAESPELTGLPPLRAASGRNEAPKLEVGATPAFSNDEIDEAVAATRPVQREHEIGSGVIRGNAHDLDGNGIPGVLVRATRMSARSRGTSDPAKIGVMPQASSLERHLRDAAEEFARGRSRQFEATSDASGAFTLKGLPKGQYSIISYAEGYLLRNKGGRAGYFAAKTGDEIEIIGEPIVEVQVSVRLTDGSEVERAIVRCSDRYLGSDDDWSQSLFGHGKNEFAWSPSAPRLRLPAKTVHLKAFANPGSKDALSDMSEFDFHSESFELELEAGATAPLVVLTVEGRSGIRGRVIFPEERLKNAYPRVHLLPLPVGAEVNLNALADAEPEVRLWRDDDEFSFLDLLPGRYAVGVNRDWGAPIDVHKVVDVGVGVVECELQLPPPDLDKFILVTVLRPDGQPAGDVSFGFTHRSGRGSSSRSGGTPLQNKDGVYLYSVPVDSRDAYYVKTSANDEFLLSVRAEGFGELEVPIAAGQRELSIQLVGEATLEVNVLGLAGSGLGDQLQVLVQALLEGGRESSTSSLSDNVTPQGKAHFDGLAAQRYLVTLNSKWRHDEQGRGYRGSVELESLEVVLQTGANLVEMTVPPLYSLDVFIDGAEDARNVSLWILSSSDPSVVKGSIGSQRTDDQGRVRFEQLPAGQYRLQAQGIGEREPFTVPCAPMTLTVTE